MHSARAIIWASTLLAGCGGGDMLPGTIYAPDGKMLDFRIEKAQRTGAVTATDRATGETFTGSYVGIKERLDVSTSNTTVKGQVVSSGFGSGSVASNVANATAFLKGDKGTVLNCQMQIEAGFTPHGLGNCEDNHGRKYRLQF